MDMAGNIERDVEKFLNRSPAIILDICLQQQLNRERWQIFMVISQIIYEKRTHQFSDRQVGWFIQMWELRNSTFIRNSKMSLLLTGVDVIMMTIGKLGSFLVAATAAREKKRYQVS